MDRKCPPPYLRQLVDHYLYQKQIEFIDSNDRLVTSKVTAKIPQSSVLGPLLWNLTFDEVLDIKFAARK